MVAVANNQEAFFNLGVFEIDARDAVWVLQS